MKAGEKGGTEVVIRAINTHINNASVCENGCCTLRNIIKGNSKNKKKRKRKNIT